MYAYLHHHIHQIIFIKVHSYLDPGSGSFILQLILAVFLGWLIVLRSYWTKIKDWLVNLFNGQAEDETNDPQ
jgi:hypothetical protein